jgi:hypothetical protein
MQVQTLAGFQTFPAQCHTASLRFRLQPLACLLSSWQSWASFLRQYFLPVESTEIPYDPRCTTLPVNSENKLFLHLIVRFINMVWKRFEKWVTQFSQRSVDRTSLWGICNGQSGNGAGFFCKFLCSFNVSIITPIFCTYYLFIYHRRFVILPFGSIVQ